MSDTPDQAPNLRNAQWNVLGFTCLTVLGAGLFTGMAISNFLRSGETTLLIEAGVGAGTVATSGLALKNQLLSMFPKLFIDRNSSSDQSGNGL